jgi:Tol biopolymer transport system component
MRGVWVGVVTAMAVVLASCGSDNATAPKHGLQVVAGTGQSDSVLSTLPQAVIVKLSETTSAGQVVQFQTLSGAYVHRLDSPQPTTFAIDTTDLHGEAAIQVVFSNTAGPVSITASVPFYGVTDTITFTALPGAATRLVATPKDTTIIVGNTATLHGYVTDQYGNARSDAVTYSVLNGPVTLSSNVATVTASGVASILVTADTFADTLYVAGLPTGSFAASNGNEITIFNFDGTVVQSITSTVGNVGAIRWSPSGTTLVFDQTAYGQTQGSGTIYTLTLGGTFTPIDQSGPYDQWPSWSRDGSTIYFSRITGAGSTLWRVSPTGTNDDSLPNQTPSFDVFSSPSPDGTQLAYVADMTSTADLRLLSVSTGAVTSLRTASAWSPAWAPTGNTIAYLGSIDTPGPIELINADGTGQRTLTTAWYAADFDWSPDAQWIIAAQQPGGINLINVASGITIPIPNTTNFWSPAWQPTSGSAGARVRRAVTKIQSLLRHAR